ncbi:MAG: YceD family protein [Acidimicrobiales bacterium]
MSGARPLVVGVAELHRQPGTQRDVECAAVLPGLRVAGSAVPDDATVAAEVVLESLADGTITATGTVRAPWAGECRRCLGPVGGELATTVREVFEAHPTEGETYRLEGDQVDLEPMVRDAVLLALPLAPLCRPDCPGPEPDAFPVGTGLADGAGDADADAPGSDERDPRWAALDALREPED